MAWNYYTTLFRNILICDAPCFLSVSSAYVEAFSFAPFKGMKNYTLHTIITLQHMCSHCVKIQRCVPQLSIILQGRPMNNENKQHDAVDKFMKPP